MNLIQDSLELRSIFLAVFPVPPACPFRMCLDARPERANITKVLTPLDLFFKLHTAKSIVRCISFWRSKAHMGTRAPFRWLPALPVQSKNSEFKRLKRDFAGSRTSACCPKGDIQR